MWPISNRKAAVGVDGLTHFFLLSRYSLVPGALVPLGLGMDRRKRQCQQNGETVGEEEEMRGRDTTSISSTTALESTKYRMMTVIQYVDEDGDGDKIIN